MTKNKKVISIIMCVIALVTLLTPITALAANTPIESSYTYDVSFYRADYRTSHEKYYGDNIAYTHYFNCDVPTALAKIRLERNVFLNTSFTDVGGTNYDPISQYYGTNMVFKDINVNTLISYRWKFNAENNYLSSEEVPVHGLFKTRSYSDSNSNNS